MDHYVRDYNIEYASLQKKIKSKKGRQGKVENIFMFLTVYLGNMENLLLSCKYKFIKQLVELLGIVVKGTYS